MAVKRTRTTRAKSSSANTKKKRPARKKKSTAQRPQLAHERVASRAWQAVILIAGSLLLFSAVVSPRAGPVIVGALVLVTALPPVRGPVDEWFTGKRRGQEAERAAAVRMALGAGVIMFTLLNIVAQI